MAPSDTAQQWFGITRTTGIPADSRLAMDLPAATLIITADSRQARFSLISARTLSTFFGLTAMTIVPGLKSLIISAASGYVLMPYSDDMRERVSSDGAQAAILSVLKTLLTISPLIMAPAIFPAPMNPIESSINGNERTG